MWYIGNSNLIWRPWIVICGPRRADAACLELARQLAWFASAELGLVVATGLARGVDQAACGPILSFGKVVGVVPYRPNWSGLAGLILKAGGLVLVTKDTTRPTGQDFLARTRLLGRLASVLIVPCGSAPSGTWACVRAAQKAGVPVLAASGCQFPNTPTLSPDQIKQKLENLVEEGRLDRIPAHILRQKIEKLP